MILLPSTLRLQLRANAIARHAAARHGRAEPDPVPVAKFFNPVGAATWLASELSADNDTLFGLADLGFGCPELGYFSLRELEALRLPFGLRIERDLAFSTRLQLSTWAAWAHRAGSILHAEVLLQRAAAPAASDPDRGARDPDPDHSAWPARRCARRAFAAV